MAAAERDWPGEEGRPSRLRGITGICIFNGRRSWQLARCWPRRLSGASLSWPWCAIMPGVPLTTDELLTTTRSVRKRLDLTRPVPPGLVQECLEIALQA